MTNDVESVVARRPLQFVGTCASPGLGRGRLYVLDDSAIGVRVRPPGGAASEAAALRAAMAVAMRELEALALGCADGEARTLLEFQHAMLEDDTLGSASLARIEAGEPGDTAWRMTLDAHIDHYRMSEDSYFAARAVDVQDLRDRVLNCLLGNDPVSIPPGSVLVARDLAPSRFLEIDWNDGGGIALFAGNAHSHVAILARARGVPMLVDLAPTATFPPGDALLDADDGVLIAAPDQAAVRAFDERQAARQRQRHADAMYLARPALCANGDRVAVLLNVADIADLRGVEARHCDGIGLVRTEFVLRAAAELQDEELQFVRYAAIVAWAGRLPVTFRTLDAGGDKPLAGYSPVNEPNPFTGLRGIRLSLQFPELLGIQLRALCRAAVVGDVKIMVPMVTVKAEFDCVRTLLNAAVAELRAIGTPCRLPQLGMMVETPAAALTLDTFGADFFSIGSNDLIAFIGAQSRDSARLAALADPLGLAFIRLVKQIIESARALQRPLSLCGDIAGDPRALAALLTAGLRSISIAPALLGRVKRLINAECATGDD